MSNNVIGNAITCPVDEVTVNENRVRITAFLVLLLAVAYLLTGIWLFPVFLLADFFIRAINLNAYSPLGLTSGFLVRLFKLKNVPVNRAPKRFAAIVGFVFLAIVVVTALLGFTLASKIITGVLIVFASLESFAGFCAGCYMYSLLKHLKLIV